MSPDSFSHKMSSGISVFFIQNIRSPSPGKRKSIPLSGAMEGRSMRPFTRLSGESAISTKIVAPFGVTMVPKPFSEKDPACPYAS